MIHITLSNSFLYGVFLLQSVNPSVRMWIDSKTGVNPTNGKEEQQCEFRVYNPPCSDPTQPPSIFPEALQDKLVGILYKSGFVFEINESDAYWCWKFWEN